MKNKTMTTIAQRVAEGVTSEDERKTTASLPEERRASAWTLYLPGIEQGNMRPVVGCQGEEMDTI